MNSGASGWFRGGAVLSGRMGRGVWALAPLLTLVWMTSGGAGSTAQSAPPALTASGPHENLNAVLWVQHSAEFVGLARQGYRQATECLERALVDPRWTAALEQRGDFAALPPAVIVDVDETVLDNSFYQARLIRDGASYGSATWDPWVEEAVAPPVAGALDFCRHAAARGVTIFYVTNRRAHLREATRRNLAAQGFPLRDDLETVLVRTAGHDKTDRRAQVAAAHRVLLLVGDNGGDFASRFETADTAERSAAEAAWAGYWGERWILVPNPMYGTWESALVGGDFSRPAEELLARKRATLRCAPSPGVGTASKPAEKPGARASF